MRVGVLGTAVASAPTGPVSLGGPKQRALLAALALHHGRAVSVDTLADLVWDGAPPPGVATTLQGYVAGLRRALEPGRATRTAATLLVTEQPGYALRLPAEDLDTTAFEAAVINAHTRVAPLADALCRGDALPEAIPDAAGLAVLHDSLDGALALWRGVPFAELGEVAAAAAERARLEELRVLAVEDRAALGILLGRHATVAAELDALTRAHPLRERAWALRALALAGSGRQADALAVLQEVRTVLDEELGLEPGAELREVQRVVLRQEHDAARRPSPGPGATTAPAADPTPVPSRWPWSLAGREEELAALTPLVDRMVAGDGGAPAFVGLTGEPGIGKSRLAIELATYAADRGATIAWGRCSQDDGAPALWPWATVLERLGISLGAVMDPTGATPDAPDSPDSPDSPEASAAPGSPEAEDDPTAAFRAWERLVHAVLAAAEHRPVLIVLDDLHWADSSSLRVLRLLTETVAEESAARLLVVATWREQPPPTGALAEAAEALARKHALRLRLGGVSTAAAAQLFAQVSETTPTSDDADTLHRRTEGNPFFLVEYARLARDGDLTALLAEDRPPAAVQEVLSRRLALLDEPARELLGPASVLGRTFDLPTLAAAARIDEEEALDRLDPPIAAGLVIEDGVDRFRFAHALVRDAVLAALPHSRRARIHARAAETLAGRPRREAEVARHWLASGPRHAAHAWPAAQAAARAALAGYGYVEALEMLEHALGAQETDADATAADRFELLADLADVLRSAGRWSELREVAHEAIEVAADAGDLDLLIRAGVMTSTGALWTPAGGEVDAEVVAALREALSRLPTGDDPRRCRVLLALAGEIYYGAAPAEREALAREAVAMARRLGDPALLQQALVRSFIAIWRGANAGERLAMADEAADLARSLDDPIGLVSALALRAEAAGELGEVGVLEASLAEGRPVAGRIRHLYAQLSLDALALAWAAMRGRSAEVARLRDEMRRVAAVVTIPGTEEALVGAALMQDLWQGGEPAVLSALGSLPPDGMVPALPPLLTVLCRGGRSAEAKDLLDAHRDRLESALRVDHWYSPMIWSMVAEVASHLGETALAAACHPLLLPLAGQTASAGGGSTLGPVDMFLALTAHATGALPEATAHADRAMALCEQWGVPLARDWCVRERQRLRI